MLNTTSPRIWVLQNRQGARLTPDAYDDASAALDAGKAMATGWPYYAAWIIQP